MHEYINQHFFLFCYFKHFIKQNSIQAEQQVKTKKLKTQIVQQTKTDFLFTYRSAFSFPLSSVQSSSHQEYFDWCLGCCSGCRLPFVGWIFWLQWNDSLPWYPNASGWWPRFLRQHGWQFAPLPYLKFKKIHIEFIIGLLASRSNLTEL